jgi:uncharacterized membrane protein YccC
MMIIEFATSSSRWLPAIDTSWQNTVFALRTVAAAILALALAYWLELSDPQWATLTVFILAQPTVGAALAKGTWRAVGTVAGGLGGLVLVALFSQAAELLVAATIFLVGVSFYAGARLRNFTSYGALLAGYTMLLVAYEGSTEPLNAWSIAIDRTTEILIGIGCATLASTIVLPRYAGDALREAETRTFAGLVGYVVTALRLSTPSSVFMRLRRQMVSEVVSFDALCSFALFEAPELRADQEYLRRTVREFLVTLSIARGLFVRLDEFDNEGARQVRDRFRSTLDAIAARIERFAADPAGSRELPRLRHELFAVQTSLKSSAEEIETLVGTAPFNQLADAILILRRVRDLLRGLAIVIILREAGRGDHAAPQGGGRSEQRDIEGRSEAWLLAIRAGLAMLLMSTVWMATSWNEGFVAVSGGAIMLFFGVNQDNPQAGARSYLIWSSVGTLLAYVAIVFVLPYLQDFGALAVFLLLLLLPAGLMAGTPTYAWAGIALGGWTIAQAGSGNVFKPDELAYVNNAFALVVGMLICLAVIAAMPVTSYAKRRELWRRAIGRILPGVARGAVNPRRASSEIVAMLATLLPRLSLDRQHEQEFFSGTLSAASSAIELGRLRDLASDPDMPPAATRAISDFLERFSDALQQVAESNSDRRARLAVAEAVVAELHMALATQGLGPGLAARATLRAAASLRFLADRFLIDRSYLERRFAED